jgi:hypothetical protein
MFSVRKKISILSGLLFLYEFIRLLFIMQRVGISGADALETLFWAGPNALFPLMAFFLCASLDRYRAYIPLYLAGKAAAIALFARFAISAAQGMDGFSTVIAYLPIIAGDVSSILFCLLLREKVKNRELNTAEPDSEGNGGF